MSEKTWVDYYYDAVAFYYWEPQHLGRKRADGAQHSESSVLEHLHSIEVTLNHIINQFLSLAPASFRNTIFEHALGQSMPGNFILSGRDSGIQRPKWDTCQPDFCFGAADGSSTVCIEMKIKACSDVDQVLKYAARALSTEQAQGRRMDHSLIFLGGGSFASLWRKTSGICSVEEVKSALIREHESFSEHRLKKNDGDDLKPRFAEIVSSLNVAFLSYDDFGELLVKEHEVASASDNGTYVLLIDGMLKELQRRKLVRETLVV
jgi:hypothetical protein